MKRMNYYLISIIMTLLVITGCAANQTNELVSNRDPDKTARLNLELGMAYMERNDSERALNRLQKSLKADPQYADAHNAIAILYSRLGETDKAGKHFEKAVRFAPNDSGALNNFGQYLCQQGQREKADKMFKRALENPLYKTPQFAHLNAGICAKEDQDPEQAEIHFRAALEQHPYMASALYQMADLSHSLKRYVPARAYIERYAGAVRHNARSLWLAVRIEKALGDRDAEASYALQLKNKFPDSPETGLLLKSEGQEDR